MGLECALRIKVVLSVRHFQELEGARAGLNRKEVSTPRRLPAKAHFPTMQVAGNAQIGVNKLLCFEVVRNVAYVDRPLGGDRNISSYRQVVLTDQEGVSVGSGHILTFIRDIMG